MTNPTDREEGQQSMVCTTCGGDGWITESEHHYNCDGTGERCEALCPVAVQVGCEHCEGTGQRTP